MWALLLLAGVSLGAALCRARDILARALYRRRFPGRLALLRLLP